MSGMRDSTFMALAVWALLIGAIVFTSTIASLIPVWLLVTLGVAWIFALLWCLVKMSEATYSSRR